MLRGLEMFNSREKHKLQVVIFWREFNFMYTRRAKAAAFRFWTEAKVKKQIHKLEALSLLRNQLRPNCEFFLRPWALLGVNEITSKQNSAISRHRLCVIAQSHERKSSRCTARYYRLMMWPVIWRKSEVRKLVFLLRFWTSVFCCILDKNEKWVFL